MTKPLVRVGPAVVGEILEEEVAQIVGPRGKHHLDRAVGLDRCHLAASASAKAAFRSLLPYDAALIRGRCSGIWLRS